MRPHTHRRPSPAARIFSSSRFVYVGGPNREAALHQKGHRRPDRNTRAPLVLDLARSPIGGNASGSSREKVFTSPFGKVISKSDAANPAGARITAARIDKRKRIHRQYHPSDSRGNLIRSMRRGTAPGPFVRLEFNERGTPGASVPPDSAWRRALSTLTSLSPLRLVLESLRFDKDSGQTGPIRRRAYVALRKLNIFHRALEESRSQGATS